MPDPSNSSEAWLAQHPEIDTIYACVCDLNGTLRGKRVPADQAAKVIDGSLRMPLSLINVDVWGRDIENSELVFESGDADGICEYTQRPLVPITWTSRPSAMAMQWMRKENGEIFEADPRRSLARIVDRFSNLGYTPVVATELEFYLYDPTSDYPQSPRSPITRDRINTDNVMSLDDIQHFDAVLDDIYGACKTQGIQPAAAISESGAGQFEINLLHVDDALKLADDVVLFKRLVRGIARNHGLAGTFMSKPFAERAGSGMHVHFSLIDKEGKNVFDNGQDDGSELLKHAVAGLLTTMQETTLALAPHQNSYRRLVPGAHAPTGIAWGYENRTAAIRIPGGENAARRIEHRVAGADVNPYLLLNSILGGALLGIDQGLTPPEPIKGDAYQLDLPQLPKDWASAIQAFATGKHVQTLFSKRLQTLFVQCKLQELKGFNEHVSSFEYNTYLENV